MVYKTTYNLINYSDLTGMIVSKDNYPLNPKGLNLANYGVVIYPDL
jgi:hypothetical protein